MNFEHKKVPSGKHLIGNSFMFQHDSDPKYTANAVKAYLDKKHTQWNTLSQDLA